MKLEGSETASRDAKSLRIAGLKSVVNSQWVLKKIPVLSSAVVIAEITSIDQESKCLKSPWKILFIVRYSQPSPKKDSMT